MMTMKEKIACEMAMDDLNKVTGGYGQIVSDEDYERCVNYIVNSNQSEEVKHHALKWLNEARYVEGPSGAIVDRGLMSYDEFINALGSSWHVFSE